MQPALRNSLRRNGFTLLELSIVLVILGLLIAGVMTGRSLIRASEMRSASADASRLATSVYSFRDKYFMLPGDVTNASAFWSGTPNGNGNGQIDYLLGNPGEEYNAWQHLALAGIIPGSYTGGVTSLPSSKLKRSFYRISHLQGVYGKSGLLISLNALDGGVLANKAVLGPDDVISIDIKLDDGEADSGSVMGFNEEGVPGCVTNDYTAGSGSYVTASTAVRCKIFFKVGN